jgi:hypothetical protein
MYFKSPFTYIDDPTYTVWLKFVSQERYSEGYPLYLLILSMSFEEGYLAFEEFLEDPPSNPASSGKVPWLEQAASELARLWKRDYSTADTYLRIITTLSEYCSFFFSDHQVFAERTPRGLIAEMQNASGTCAMILCAESANFMIGNMTPYDDRSLNAREAIFRGIDVCRHSFTEMVLPEGTTRDEYYMAERAIKEARVMQRFGRDRGVALDAAEICLWMVSDGYDIANGESVGNAFHAYFSSPKRRDVDYSALIPSKMSYSIMRLSSSYNFYCRIVPKDC